MFASQKKSLLTFLAASTDFKSSSERLPIASLSHSSLMRTHAMNPSFLRSSKVVFFTLIFVLCRKPIFPKEELSVRQNAEFMKNENYSVWKKVYEEFYGIPLVYSEEEK